MDISILPDKINLVDWLTGEVLAENTNWDNFHDGLHIILGNQDWVFYPDQLEYDAKGNCLYFTPRSVRLVTILADEEDYGLGPS